MEKLLFRKVSILGLVLMGASALTAAVIPNKNQSKLDIQGSVTQNNTSLNGINTCSQTAEVTEACNITDGTATTLDGQDDSTVNGNQTAANTTVNS